MTKLGVCVTLVHHLHGQLQIRVNKNTYYFGTSKSSVRNQLENQCNLYFLNHNSAVEFLLILKYSTIIKILLLCQVDIQESSRKDNAKFNFLDFPEVIWESKRSWRAHFQAFKEPRNQNFCSLGTISGTYWVYYKPPVLSYLEVGTYGKRVLEQAEEVVQRCSVKVQKMKFSVKHFFSKCDQIRR